MAATEQDVVLAILAMDAYNQGYSPGMSMPNETPIDGASIIADSTALLGDSPAAASFYAIAYSWNGETVISYRGYGGYGDMIPIARILGLMQLR